MKMARNATTVATDSNAAIETTVAADPNEQQKTDRKQTHRSKPLTSRSTISSPRRKTEKNDSHADAITAVATTAGSPTRHRLTEDLPNSHKSISRIHANRTNLSDFAL